MKKLSLKRLLLAVSSSAMLILPITACSNHADKRLAHLLELKTKINNAEALAENNFNQKVIADNYNNLNKLHHSYYLILFIPSDPIKSSSPFTKFNGYIFGNLYLTGDAIKDNNTFVSYCNNWLSMYETIISNAKIAPEILKQSGRIDIIFQSLLSIHSFVHPDKIIVFNDLLEYFKTLTNNQWTSTQNTNNWFKEHITEWENV